MEKKPETETHRPGFGNFEAQRPRTKDRSVPGDTAGLESTGGGRTYDDLICTSCRERVDLHGPGERTDRCVILKLIERVRTIPNASGGWVDLKTGEMIPASFAPSVDLGDAEKVPLPLHAVWVEGIGETLNELPALQQRLIWPEGLMEAPTRELARCRAFLIEE